MIAVLLLAGGLVCNETSAESVQDLDLTAGFEALDLQGRLWTYEEMKGRVVLIEFWATWCTQCLAEIENLKKAYTFAHEFYATHFAGNYTEGLDGLTREDLVNSYIFVVREMKARGMTVTPKDELDSAAKDLDADLFKQSKAGKYQTSVDEGHRHVALDRL